MEPNTTSVDHSVSLSTSLLSAFPEPITKSVNEPSSGWFIKNVVSTLIVLGFVTYIPVDVALYDNGIAYVLFPKALPLPFSLGFK